MIKKISLLSAFASLFALSALAQSPISQRQWMKLNQTLFAITQFYVDTVNESKVIDDAITGMLDKLDPHSVYIPASEAARANEGIEGSFEGIGIQYQLLRDTLVVLQSMSGCPAEKVGIVIGDKFIAVDNQPIAGVKIKTNDIQKLLRGKRGTKVNVRVLRAGVKGPIDFVITRDKIPLYSLDAAYMIAPEVGYIKLNSFSNTTMKEYHDAMKALKAQNAKSLILDLQSNGGGLMNAAVDLSDEFLSAKKNIVYAYGAHQPHTPYDATSQGDFEKGKVVVLVDEYSASASEIVSGALQDWDRAVIVGRRTFGKGLVQRRFPLEDGAEMRLTIARYYTPSGRNIQKPYEGGSEKYHKELEERYKHGEFQHADSIVFPDSLKYKTLTLGRTVYGGGGIMPDVFVPLDTTRFTNFHRDLVAKGAMNKTVVEYLETQNSRLKKRFPTFDDYNAKFTPDEALIKQLLDNGTAAKVTYKADEFETSKSQILLQLKALIARSLYENGDYFKIMNVEDPIVMKGLDVLKNYDSYLK